MIDAELPPPPAEPAKSPFDELDIDKELVCQFFAMFARFEYAMKATRFLWADRHGNAVPNWQELRRELANPVSDTKDKATRAAVAYLLAEPPEVQKVIAGRAEFQSLALADGTDGAKAIEAAQRVRNNLFHGGKHTAHSSPGRDERLIRSAMAVLYACLAADGALLSEYEHQRF